MAVHWQWESVATSTILCCFLCDTVNDSGVTAYVHAGNCACSTRNSRPPTLSAAARAGPEFAAAAILSVADPLPLEGETVIQLGAPVTVQAHPADELIETDAEPPEADALNTFGVTVKLQGGGGGGGAGGGGGSGAGGAGAGGAGAGGSGAGSSGAGGAGGRGPGFGGTGAGGAGAGGTVAGGASRCATSIAALDTLTFSVRALPVLRATRTVISAVPCPRSGVTAIHEAVAGNSHEQKSSVVKTACASPPVAAIEIFAGDRLHVQIAASCEISAR